MIRLAAPAHLASLSYHYPGETVAALVDVDLDLQPGLTLVSGPSGGGKSTLLRVLNGLVPHFHGGRIGGAATVLGLDVLTTPTRWLARQVGFVFQDPELQAVYGTVEREVAFALENTGADPARMGDEVDAALSAVGVLHLRGRALATLSGGERQRVAIASAMALRPDLIVLDEPSSQLDWDGARQVAHACRRLADQGSAVVVTEHRLDWLLPVADGLVLVEGGRIRGPAPAGAMAGRLATPPPLVELGLRLGWTPLPLSIEAARPLAPKLSGRAVIRPRSSPGWTAKGLTISATPGAEIVLEAADIEGGSGEVVVVIGANGSGKTTLLRVLAGLLKPRAGSVERQAGGRVAYLPQNPGALLHRPTLRSEVELTLARSGDSEPPEAILAELGLSALAGRYPRDLSSGQRQRAALAAVLAGSPALALLDEPTRGMDGEARARLGKLLRRLAGRGCAVVLATHDLDLAAEVGDRILLLKGGRALDLGHPETALSGDVRYATQIGRLYPGGPVTVAGVLGRLSRLDPR